MVVGGERSMATPDRVRIGNQTAYKALPPGLPFEYAVARGFDAFEWFPDRRPSGQGWDAADLGPEQRAALRERARDADIALSVHAKLPADPLDPGARAHLDEGLRLAADLGAVLLNVHFSRADSVARYAEAVEPWGARCAAAGLRLAIENTPEDGPDDFNELFERLGGGVGMCLDIGHANLHPATRNDYLGYIDRLGPHVPIIHIHAHENYGDRDSHLPVFSGPARVDEAGIAGFVDRMRRREFRGSVVIEQWPDPPDLLDRARDGLARLFGRP